jgi:hypothetical protein
MAIQQPQQIRVPNLPLGPMVDDKGAPVPAEITFRQALITSLQQNFGNEGLVAPSQTNVNPVTPGDPPNAITTIQNNTLIINESDVPVYTCQGGTLLYDSTNNNLLVCILASDGTPTFKVVTVT